MSLTLIWVDFLGVRFEVGEGLKLTPSRLKLIRIMLEIWHVSTHTYVVLENIPFSTKTLLILLMSTFFCKRSLFFGKNSTFTQSNSARAVLGIF